jgi:sterol desaturase/sphingolipid hydroxylase (fatty acid hydroxylase superfamily)
MTKNLFSNILNKILSFGIFYMTFFVFPEIVKTIWPREIKDTKNFLFWFQLINHHGIFFLCNFILYLIYRYENDYIRSLKVNEEEWPWIVNKAEWINFLKKNFGIIFFNQFIIVPSLLYLKCYIREENQRTSYESWPSALEVIWQVIFCMIIEDFGFYWSHRFLHWKPIYPYIHKIHHEHRNAVSIASEYAHPVEFIIGNVLPTNLGVVILGGKIHSFTTALWIIIRIVKTTHAHCGYKFPWALLTTLPGQTGSEFHNYHHAKFIGNYSSFFIFWDYAMGTVHPGYLEYKMKLDGKKND